MCFLCKIIPTKLYFFHSFGLHCGQVTPTPQVMIRKLLCFVLLLGSIQIAVSQDMASSSNSNIFLEDLVSFYPNPSTDQIKVTNVSGEAVRFSVYNILGDEVLRAQLTKIETELSLDKLPSGVYIAAFYHNDKTITERLIKE